MFKRADGLQFDKDVLEKYLPSAEEHEAERMEMWKLLDNNGSDSVSLAEFDGWFNKHFIGPELEAGNEAINGQSGLYLYGKPCFIRAFNLANGVSKVQTRGADDYITHDEFRLLMVATQASLVIYRLFDIADESDDRRVEQSEWDNQLDEINTQLTDYGYTGPAIVSEDFSKIDVDGGGMILLNEAITFFLDKFTDEEALHAENEAEGVGQFSKQPSIKPVVEKRQVMSRAERAARAKEKKAFLDEQKRIEKYNREVEKQNRRIAAMSTQ